MTTPTQLTFHELTRASNEEEQLQAEARLRLIREIESISRSLGPIPQVDVNNNFALRPVVQSYHRGFFGIGARLKVTTELCMSLHPLDHGLPFHGRRKSATHRLWLSGRQVYIGGLGRRTDEHIGRHPVGECLWRVDETTIRYVYGGDIEQAHDVISRLIARHPRTLMR